MKRKESIFLVAQAAIVVGVLLLVSLPIQSTNLQSDSSISEQGPCSSTPVSTQSLLAPIENETRLSNGTSVNETFYSALFLQPNSIGMICVTYADASGSAISLVAGHNYFVGTFNITKPSNGGETISLVPISTGVLDISANPGEIHVQAGQSEVVVYTLRSSSNSAGLYQAFFPPGSCSGLPVFVGGSASQVNATEYSQLAFISNFACTAMYGNLYVESIAFSNVGVNYVGQPSNSSSAMTTTVSSDSTGTQGVAGLNLLMTDNASKLQVGQRLNVNVSLVNRQSSANSVTAAQDWPFQGVPVALWPSCYFATPAYAVVLEGNYTAEDLQSLANATFPMVCTAAVSVDHVIFQPTSSQANITGIYDVTGANLTLGPFNLSLNFTTDGYWDLVANSRQLNPPIIGEPGPSSIIATPFVPGVYTVAVADEWGQVAVLHFVVEEPTN